MVLWAGPVESQVGVFILVFTVPFTTVSLFFFAAAFLVGNDPHASVTAIATVSCGRELGTQLCLGPIW